MIMNSNKKTIIDVLLPFTLQFHAYKIYLNQLLQLQNGQSGAIVMASNSSDRSDKSDKPMDQKVLILSPMPSLLF